MTSTMSDARPRGQTAGPSRPPTAGRHATADHTLASDVSATVPLLLYSVAVAAGFARVFSGWQFFDNLVVIVVVGHGMGLLLRRLRVPGVLAVPLLALVLVWLIGFVHYRSTYTAWLPNTSTYDLFTAELERIGEQFPTAKAPVIYGGGWDVLASIGIAVAVLLGDTFAFRAYGRAEALVPGGVLFVFVAALGDDRQRVALAVLLVGTGVFATSMLRAYHATVRRSTIGGVRSAASLALPGALMAALVIGALAGIVGPRLPGARSEAIYDTTQGGSDVSTVVNPLVDIRKRLIDQSPVELFTMEATSPSYWRTAALSEFDGRRWRIPEGQLRPADGDLLQPRASSQEIVQSLSVSSLSGSFIPAAPDARFVTGGPGVEIRQSEEMGLLLKTDGDLVRGESFDIVSASPRFTPAELSAASSTDAGDPIFLELPDDFPEIAVERAEEVTATASSPYDAALQLQMWFRDFRYSLEVQEGNGSNDIEAFLRDRVGYCEQFAGTYAAMMRHLGYPARVAVGFTWGDETAEGVYTVRGKNAHAWPEVWFDGLGWVKFEPTPGRGAADAENYTFAEAAQDETPVDPEAPATGEGDGTAPSTTVALPQDDQRPLGDLDGLVPATGTDSMAPPAEEPGRSYLPWLWIGALVVALAALPALSRWWWRRVAPANDDQLRRLWERATRALHDVGVPASRSQTPHETAELAAHDFPISSRAVRSLADAVTESTYRPDGSAGLERTGSYGRSRIRECGTWTRQIERATLDSQSAWKRVVRHFTTWR